MKNLILIILLTSVSCSSFYGEVGPISKEYQPVTLGRQMDYESLKADGLNRIRIDQISHVLFTLDLGSPPSEIQCRPKRAVVYDY
jgi:hypothetical protein